MDTSALRRALRGSAVDLADALFPWACALCGARAEDSVACAAHRIAAAPRGEASGRCGRCAARLPARIPGGSPCRRCRVDPPRWSRLVALADYGEDPAARAWILALKHGGRADLARPLGEWLARRLADAGACPADALVVPVPLHPWRRFARGHDQALLVARAAAFALGLPCLPALARERATPPQGAPGARSRRANVHGAFAVRRGAARRLAGRRIVLVDDVVTSGATASECARTLRAAGALEVLVACLARASPRLPGSAGAPGDAPSPRAAEDAADASLGAEGRDSG